MAGPSAGKTARARLLLETQESPLLASSIVPPCFSTIPRLTQRPRPVPCSPLVVKKGLKSLARCSVRNAGTAVSNRYRSAGPAIGR